MSLFFKIFLWFWFGMALVAGIFLFVGWTTQREPFQGRARIGFTNQINVYTELIRRAYENEGTAKAAEFAEQLRISEQIKDICFYRSNNRNCFDGEHSTTVAELLQKSAETGEVNFNFVDTENTFIAKQIKTSDGMNPTLILKIRILPPPVPFGADWQTGLLRVLLILLATGILCYLLTAYLLKPVLMVRDAAEKLAQGNLQTRIDFRRRDEPGELARAFNHMAERLENLIGSQQRLSRDISHELRSPLARLNVALELAKQKSNPETAALLDRIETESTRLNEMISRILTLSRLESQVEKIEKRDVNLTKIVEQVAADAEFEAGIKGKSVKIVRADECRLKGNERLLQSAVENVVRNAVKYTKPETAVEISLKKTASDVAIVTRDHGIGIPEKELGEIFKPFYRIAEARDRRTGGIGLGLAITEQAVRAHDGKIIARNTDDGLEIKITLPLNGAHQ